MMTMRSAPRYNVNSGGYSRGSYLSTLLIVVEEEDLSISSKEAGRSQRVGVSDDDGGGLMRRARCENVPRETRGVGDVCDAIFR